MHLSSAIPWGWGGVGGGKAGDFVKFLLASAYFPLLEGDIEQSQLRNCLSHSHHREEIVNLIARPTVVNIICFAIALWYHILHENDVLLSK